MLGIRMKARLWSIVSGVFGRIRTGLGARPRQALRAARSLARASARPLTGAIRGRPAQQDVERTGGGSDLRSPDDPVEAGTNEEGGRSGPEPDGQPAAVDGAEEKVEDGGDAGGPGEAPAAVTQGGAESGGDADGAGEAAEEGEQSRTPDDLADADADADADYPLGAEIVVLGAQAAAVFEASSRVRGSLDDGHVDLVLVARPDDLGPVGPPVVALQNLAPTCSVPAFDPLTVNPIGWVREPTGGVGALGPPELLPSGAAAAHFVAREDRGALRLLHHLQDVAGYHTDGLRRAGTLAALAGMGVVVHLADRDAALENYLGEELYGLMSAPDILAADLDGRERISVNMRRAALRDHSLRRRARDVIAAGLPDPPDLPRVSILAPTRRPQLVGRLLRTVADQTYPHLELILLLHGEGFNPTVEAEVSDSPYPARVLRISGELSLGAVLNRGLLAASGRLITKFDDDDLYAADHIWDLVLAHEYSGAELVAKGSEFVYLAGSDATLHRFTGKGETHATVPTAGAAMLASRHALHAAGGWRRLTLGEDRALVEDVRSVGGSVYRTHGFGFVTVRHGSGHTWQADDEYFLSRAETVVPGWAPEYAGLDSRAVPHMSYERVGGSGRLEVPHGPEA